MSDKKESKKLTIVNPPHFFTTKKGGEAIRMLVRDVNGQNNLLKAMVFDKGLVAKIKADTTMRENFTFEAYGSLSADPTGTESFVINAIIQDWDTRSVKDKMVHELGGTHAYREYVADYNRTMREQGLVKILLKNDKGEWVSRWQSKEHSIEIDGKWWDQLEYANERLGVEVVNQAVKDICAKLTIKVGKGMSDEQVAQWKAFKLALVEQAKAAPSGILDSFDEPEVVMEYPPEVLEELTK